MRIRDLFAGRPIEPTRTRPTTTTTQPPRAQPESAASVGRNYTVTAGVGAFGEIKFPWEGTDDDDVERSFFEYLQNAEFDVSGRPGWRSHEVVFYGQRQRLLFQPEWVSAFTVSRGSKL